MLGVIFVTRSLFRALPDPSRFSYRHLMSERKSACSQTCSSEQIQASARRTQGRSFRHEKYLSVMLGTTSSGCQQSPSERKYTLESDSPWDGILTRSSNGLTVSNDFRLELTAEIYRQDTCSVPFISVSERK